MRIRWAILAPMLTCVGVLVAYDYATTNAGAVPSQSVASKYPDAAPSANELAPGEFRFTTGRDKVPQHIRGPVACDSRDDIDRIAIGNPDAGGLEIGISHDDSTLKYAFLGYRNGVHFAVVNDAVVNDAQTGGDGGSSPASLRKTENTYFASGTASGTTASQHTEDLYFEITVACP